MNADSSRWPQSDRGRSADLGDARSRRRPMELLEWLTLVHAGSLAIASAWAFGGQADWVRGPLTAWAALSFFITLATLLRNDVEGSRRRAVWLSLLPLVLFNAIVLVAATNPSFRELRNGTETFFAAVGGRPGLPSSARPELARQALLQFDAAWLTCFNVLLVVRHRRGLRVLLVALALNAVAIAVFGTAQKMVHAPGLFFGAVPSPQRFFFGPFVYHNHWGAFALLALSLGLGALAYYGRHGTRDRSHSPAATGVICLLIVAAAIPLSASRSCTLVAAVLLGGALVHWVTRQIRSRLHFHESLLPPILVALAAVAVAAGAAWYVGRDTIAERSALTVQQLHQARTAAAPDARMQLYRDTWHMAADKRWFGWGMASYPYVFTLYNTRTSIDRLPVFYHDAHSDWLQAFAEHGFVGSALLASLALIPLAVSWRRMLFNPVSVYPLVGCTLVAAYAWLEFPFGNFAVVVSWWLCFFIALRYAQLSWTKRERTAALSSPAP